MKFFETWFLPAGIVVVNIVFNKVWLIEKFYTTYKAMHLTNLTNLFCYKYAREAYLRHIIRTESRQTSFMELVSKILEKVKNLLYYLLLF